MKMFKKPIEKINIKVPDIPKTTNKQVSDDEIYYERAKVIKINSFDNDYDPVTKKNKILDNINNFENKSASLFHTYYFLKLFIKAATKDHKFNEQMLLIDKQINRIKKNYEDLKKRTDILKYVDVIDEQELDEIYERINGLFDFYSDLNKDLTTIQSAYYRNLKMTSYSICNDKTYLELDTINKSILKTFDEFKTMQEAYDFIYYNSGELIVNCVKALVNCFENNANKTYIKTYRFEYFLDSDYVVVLKFTEWIELFNKIRYVMRTTNGVELFDYLNFKNYYQELEKRYIIMLIYNEMSRV